MNNEQFIFNYQLEGQHVLRKTRKQNEDDFFNKHRVNKVTYLVFAGNSH